jgi:hypothetical protein
MHASDEAIRRALELALEYDLALRLTAQGYLEILGRLDAVSSKARPAEAALPAAPTSIEGEDAEVPRQVRCLVGEWFSFSARSEDRT